MLYDRINTILKKNGGDIERAALEYVNAGLLTPQQRAGYPQDVPDLTVVRIMIESGLRDASITPAVLDPSTLNPCHSALMDYNSAEAIVDGSMNDRCPDPRQLHQSAWGLKLMHIIQALVLHEVIVFDSILIDSETYGGLLANCQDFGVYPVYIDGSVRSEIGDILDSFTIRNNDEVLELVGKEAWDAIHLTFDVEELQEFKSGTRRITRPEGWVDPLDILSAEDYEDLRLQGDFEGGKHDVPSVVLRSGNTIQRIHFYVELGRYLDIPLQLDPPRTEYLKKHFEAAKNGSFRPGGAESPVERFDRTIRTEFEDRALEGPAVDIPAVPEYVLTYGRGKNMTIADAVLEVRHSERAKAFREYSSLIEGLRREGRRGVAEHLRLTDEFDKIVKRWIRDVHEGLDYRTRILNLVELPWVGRMLKAVNMESLAFRDPILWKGKSEHYLWFLNDLLRPVC